MAQGDVKSGMLVVPSLTWYEIRPNIGEEWVIHNIYYNGGVDFLINNGSFNVPFDRDTTAGARMGCMIHITNSQWLVINNYTGANVNIAYDGIQTK